MSASQPPPAHHREQPSPAPSFGKSRPVIIGMLAGILFGIAIGATQGQPRTLVIPGMLLGMVVGMLSDHRRHRGSPAQ